VVVVCGKPIEEPANLTGESYDCGAGFHPVGPVGSLSATGRTRGGEPVDGGLMLAPLGPPKVWETCASVGSNHPSRKNLR
jgi:hypothetical protein